MHRVLVPLDGSDFAAAILLDARRLAGAQGELILFRDIGAPSTGEPTALQSQAEIEETARVYLDAVAGVLRSEGVRVQTHPPVSGDTAVAIDEAAELLHADMIAAATHGRSAAERSRAGSVAWRALLRSTVPVLLRHVDPANPLERAPEPDERRLMVPLDGSALAEKALPLAQQLAAQWNASIWLVHVVPQRSAEEDAGDEMNAETAGAYLDTLARGLSSGANWQVVQGPIEDGLVRAADDLRVTDIVLTSQGRTATSRAVMGSVVNDLIHTVRCPVIVIPILAAMSRELELHAPSVR